MKTHLHFIIATIAFAFLSFGANARMVKNAPVGEIPFTIDGDSRIYVTAFVNGSDSLRFLVDTGASSIVLNTNSPKLKGFIHNGQTASILGTTGEKDYSSSDDNSIQIGSVRYENIHCFNVPYSPESWDGLLGLNGLSEYDIEINYDDFKIYCYPKERLDFEKSCVSIPFVYKYGVPFIKLPVRLNGKRYKLLLELDTGSDRVIDLNTPFVNKNNLLGTKKPFAVSHVRGADGSIGELKDVYFDEVTVGSYIMPKVAGAFSTLTSGMLGKEDIDGMIGNNFLKRFNMLIDFKNNRIYLQPNNFYYSPFYDALIND